eukprot:441045-Rhodomonas_salina.1
MRGTVSVWCYARAMRCAALSERMVLRARVTQIRNTMDPASQHTLITVDDFQRFSTGEQDEGRGR